MVKVRRKKIVRVVPSMDKVKIACLGHSKKQFDTIPHRKWLVPTYLDNLNLGFYSDYQKNDWAEGRAFLCDSLFDYSSCDYVGTVTASWNLKFYRSNLENLDRHEHIHKLFDNNTVITSLLEPFWMWDTMFDYIGFTNGTKISDFVKSYFKGIDTNKLVPLSNQVICHKSIYKNLCDFHKSVVEDIRQFVDKYGDVPENELTRSRKYAYVVEAMTMAYFQSKDYNYIPVAKLHPQWYNPRAAAKRYRDDNRQNK